MTTLQELIEEVDSKRAVVRIIIGGAVLPKWTSLAYDFQIGQVPTAVITVPNRAWLPGAVAEEASVEIWFGYIHGVTIQERLVFGGAVVDSVGNDGPEVIIECVMDGPRKLSYSYNRTIAVDFSAVTAEAAVIDLLTLAGVTNYAINLDPWVIGTAVPQTIEFSSYGEAINKVSEVDGSPWYAMPTGQVRVENRDPVPSTTARRTYFSGVLTGSIETAPTSITNPDARPRINDIQRRKFRSEVANFITVTGAVLVSLGPNGEQNSNQISEEVDGASGQFPNGAYWIPTPPLFQHFIFSNELVDTNAKAFEVAERYFNLKNRLFEEMPLSIPGEPDVFLGATVKVIDPNYSGVSSLYFVKGYRTSIDSGNCTTELELTGGPESGTTGFASPFAEFTWKYEAIHDLIPGTPIPGGDFNFSGLNFGPGSDLGAKLCVDVPDGTGSETDEEEHIIDEGDNFDLTGGFNLGVDNRTVIIGLDGTASQDFDGHIVSYTWTYIDSLDVERTRTGPRVSLIFDPDVTSFVEVTLTVVDNSGRDDSITKTIFTSADYLDPGGGGLIEPLDPSLDDTPFGGGVAVGPCTVPEVPGGSTGNNPGQCAGMELGYFIAAGEYAMGTFDNRTWNDLARGSVTPEGVVGQFISVAAGVNFDSQRTTGIFGTDAGEVVVSIDGCLTGELVFRVPSGAAITVIQFDSNKMGIPAQGESVGDEGGGGESGLTVYTQEDPGTLTIMQAFQQALAVGFSPTAAIIAVAIMKAESGLVSNITNTIGNVPPSTDRGIAQINSYYHPEVSDTCAFNTACAIKAMFNISSGGTDFTPWTVFTGGQYRNHLSVVQEAVGIDGPIGGGGGEGYASSVIQSTIGYLGTSDGQIFISMDSGRTWDPYKTADGLPIYSIITSSRFALGDGITPVMILGGNTSNPNSLIRIATSNEGTFESIQLSEALRAAIALAPGRTIRSAVLGASALMIAFDDGVEPLVWFSPDPIGDPESWYPAVEDLISEPYGLGISGDLKASAGGFVGEFIMAGSSGTSATGDSHHLVTVSSQPSNLEHIIWLGIPGLYIAAAAASGIKMTMDYGTGWGSLRPNSEFGTAWPGGAIANQLALSIGPRACNFYTPSAFITVVILRCST